MVLILLPPSEGKTRAESGAAVDLEALSFAELTPHRHEVLDALAAVSAAPDALKILGVGASLEAEVEANITLRRSPAAPAHAVYSGVLYDALGYPRLTPRQRQRADATIVVVSALWGATGFADAIPAYRLSMGVGLQGIGKLAAWWKPRLTPVLDARAGDDLVIDARSSTYAAAYKPPVGTSVSVDVVQIRAGVRKVVSHFAKHTRGELVRHVLQARTEPRTPAELLRLAQKHWPLTELEPATKSKPARLVVVLPEDHAFTARG